MSYTNGTRTSQANPAEDLVTLIDTALTAHTGWSKIEDVTVSTGKSSVYKSASATNGVADFYVVLSRGTAAGTTTLYISGFEVYDSVNHKYGRPCQFSSSLTGGGSTTPSTDGSFTTATTYTFSTTGSLNQSSTATGALFGAPFLLSTTSYDYWISVTDYGLFVSSKTAGNTQVGYVGLFDSLVATPATNDPMPLVTVAFTSASPAAATSRHPLVTTAIFAPWMHLNIGATVTNWTPTDDIIGSTTASQKVDLFQGGKFVGTRALLKVFGQSGNDVAGLYRGLLRGCLMFANNSGTGAVHGDTLTINGTTWVLLSGVTVATMIAIDTTV